MKRNPKNLPSLKIGNDKNKFGNMGLSDYSASNRPAETNSTFRLGMANAEIDESEEDYNEFASGRDEK